MQQKYIAIRIKILNTDKLEYERKVQGTDTMLNFWIKWIWYFTSNIQNIIVWFAR
jgi:hypothetical protein